MMMNDDRLAVLSSFVRKGAVAADVGTDHGKLALLLIRRGIASHVYATDINEKPLSKAKSAIAFAGLGERITPLLADGLIGLSHLPLSDIVIAGMGGELIAKIMAESDFLKKGVRFVLQPMSRAEVLRDYLCHNGFCFIDETLVKDNGRTYPVLAVEYDGEKRSLTPLEKLVGPCLLSKRAELSPLLVPFLKAKADNLLKIRNGKVSARLDASAEEALLAALAAMPAETEEGQTP